MKRILLTLLILLATVAGFAQTQLAGTFDVSTVGWCGNTFDGQFTWNADGDNFYSVDGGDFSYGAYDACYGDGTPGSAGQVPAGNLQIFNNGGSLEPVGTSQWGEVYTFNSVSMDGSSLTIDWINDYGEAGVTTLTRHDGQRWELLFNAAPFTADLISRDNGKVWKLAGANSLRVGPSPGSGIWFTGPLPGERDCLLDDEYIFNSNGTFSLENQGLTWLETPVGGPDNCEDPTLLAYPYNQLVSGDFSYSINDGVFPAEITVSGTGAYIGLNKAYNGGEYNGADLELVTDITYQVLTYADMGDREVLEILLDITTDGSIFWTFTLEAFPPPPFTPVDFVAEESAADFSHGFDTGTSFGLAVDEIVEFGDVTYGVDVAGIIATEFIRTDANFGFSEFQMHSNDADLRFDTDGLYANSMAVMDVYIPSSNDFSGQLINRVEVLMGDQSGMGPDENGFGPGWWNAIVEARVDDIPLDQWVTLEFDFTRRLDDPDAAFGIRDNLDILVIRFGGLAHPEFGTIYYSNFRFEPVSPVGPLFPISLEGSALAGPTEMIGAVATHLANGTVLFRGADNTPYGDNEGDGILDAGGADIIATEGDYSIRVDAQTLEYFIAPINSIGLLGTARGGDEWGDPDTDLINEGGGIYTLNNVELLAGEWKIRANDDWGFYNWGDNEGDGILDEWGANIQQEAGVYNITVDILNNTYSVDPIPFNPTFLSNAEGKVWSLAGPYSYRVGPTPGSGDWWPGPDEDVAAQRGCIMDDEFIFYDDGTFSINNQSSTWVEPYLGSDERCADPSTLPYPYNQFVSGDFSYSIFDNGVDPAQLTVTGPGAYIGFNRPFNGGEYNGVEAELVSSITYDVLSYFDEGNRELMEITIDFSNDGSGAYWTFVLEATDGQLPGGGTVPPPIAGALVCEDYWIGGDGANYSDPQFSDDGYVYTVGGNNNDFYLLKYDLNGNLVHSKNLDADIRALVPSIAIDGDFLYLTGSYRRANFGDGERTSENYTPFVAKFDLNFNNHWVVDFPSDGFSEAMDVDTDSEGSVFITGRFRNRVDIAGESIFGGAQWTPLIKLDPFGNVVWYVYSNFTDAGGNNTNSRGWAMDVDAEDNIYITGYFSHEMSFGGDIIYSENPNNPYVAKFDNFGNNNWVRGFPNDGTFNPFYDVLADDIGSVYATGVFVGGVDTNGDAEPDVFSNGGGSDILLVKLDASSGSTMWANAIGGFGDLTNGEWGGALELYNGNIALAGQMASTDYTYQLDRFGNSVTDDADFFNFFAKYDPNGTFLALIKTVSQNGAIYGASAYGDYLFTTHTGQDGISKNRADGLGADNFLLTLTSDGPFTFAVGGSAVADANIGGTISAYEWYRDGELYSTDAQLIVTESGEYGLSVVNESGCWIESANTIFFDVFEESLATDQEVLNELYASFDGNNWNNTTGWNDGTELGVGTWHGVEVTEVEPGIFRVTGLDLSYNNLGQGFNFVNMQKLTSLQYLNLRGNGGLVNFFTLENLNTLPNLTTIDVAECGLDRIDVDMNGSSVTSFDVSNNFLKFQHLEPYIGITNFTYAPQNDEDIFACRSRGIGEDIEFFASDFFGDNTTYEWYFNGALTGETSHTISRNVQADSYGQYYVYVRNTFLTGLDYSVTIDLNPLTEPVTINQSLSYQGESTLGALGSFGFNPSVTFTDLGDGRYHVSDLTGGFYEPFSFNLEQPGIIAPGCDGYFIESAEGSQFAIRGDGPIVFGPDYIEIPWYDDGNAFAEVTLITGVDFSTATSGGPTSCGDYWIAEDGGSWGAPQFDVDGLVYSVGIYVETNDMIQLLKYDPNDGMLNSLQLNGTFRSLSPKVHIHGNELYLIGSYFEADFGDGLRTSDNSTPFIAKYDLDFNFQWVVDFPSDGFSEMMAIDTDNFGDVYVSGRFRNNVTIDGQTIAGGNQWTPLIKLSPDGFIYWHITSNFVDGSGNSANSRGWEMDIDDNNEIYLTGYFSYELDFGNGIAYGDWLDPYVAKFDVNGFNHWIKPFPQDGNFQAFYGVKSDGMGAVYATGVVDGGVDTDFDGAQDLFSYGARDILFVKLDANDGSTIWANSVGGDSDGFEWGTTVDIYNGNVVLAGQIYAEDGRGDNFQMDRFGASFSGRPDFPQGRQVKFLATYSPSGRFLSASPLVSQRSTVYGGAVYGDHFYSSVNFDHTFGKQRMDGQDVASFTLRMQTDAPGVFSSNNTYFLSADFLGSASEYQWYRDGAFIGNGAEIVIDQTGEYDLYVLNTFGCFAHSQNGPFFFEVFNEGIDTDIEVLNAFYDAFNGDSWNTNAGWRDGSPVESWFGVQVLNGRVVGLDLAYNGIGCDGTQNYVDFTKLTALEYLNLEGNCIGDFWNLGQLYTLPNLFDVNFSNNWAYEVPDLGGSPVQILNVSHNTLRFPQLERNTFVPEYYYSPQFNEDVESTYIANVGEDIYLGTNHGSPNTRYEWYFNGEFTGENSGDIFRGAISESDFGEYTVRIFNDILPDIDFTESWAVIPGPIVIYGTALGGELEMNYPIEYLSTTTFVAIANFATAGTIRFRTPDGAFDWGDNEGDGIGEIGGADINVAAGVYAIRFDVYTDEYSLDPITTVGFIGSARTGNDNGWADPDWDMVDAGNGVYYLEGIDLYEGYWKIRANDNWDFYNWGDNEGDGFLEPWGADIYLEQAGTYYVEVDIINNTYFLDRASTAECANALDVGLGTYSAGPPEWFVYNSPGYSQEITISSVGWTEFDTYLKIYGSCEDPNPLIQNDDAGGINGLQSQVTLTVYPNESVYILWDNVYSNEPFEWTITNSAGACLNAMEAVAGVNFSEAPPQWFFYTAPEDQEITITSVGYTDSDTFLKIFEDCMGSPVALNDDFGGTNGRQSELSGTIAAGETILILWDNDFGFEPFEWEIITSTIGTGIECADALLINEGQYTAPAQPYWYEYIAYESQIVTISSANGAGVNTHLRLYDACGVSAFAENDDFNGDVGSELTLEMSAGQSIFIEWAATYSIDAFNFTISSESTVNPCDNANLIDLGTWYGEPEQWFRYKAPFAQNIRISSAGLTSSNTYLKVFSSCSDELPFAENDDFNGELSSELELSLVTDQTIYILWDDVYSTLPINWVIEVLNDTRQAQTITFDPISDKTFGDVAFTLNASSDATGLPVQYRVTQGLSTVSLTASLVTIVGTGNVTIEASNPGNDQYLPAAASQSFTVNKANATVTISDLTQTWDGNPKEVSVTTAPTGLTVNVTYAGVETAPTDVGSYEVVATVENNLYEGSATATLVIDPATVSITISDTDQTFDGTEKSVTVTADPNVAFELTYDGASTLPINAGSYAVHVEVTETSYTGSADATLTINQASATVTIDVGSLDQVYDGGEKTVTVTTDPAGLGVEILYEGSTTPPVNAGSYTVEANLTDNNYSGSTAATLNIGKGQATVFIDGLEQDFDGDPKEVIVNTDPEGLSVIVTYDGGSDAPVNANEDGYAVIATVDDANWDGAAAGTLIVHPGLLLGAGLDKIINVYPNPATTILNLNYPDGSGIDWSISDISGKTIGYGTLNGKSHVINVSEYISGIYHIQIRTKDAVGIYKIVVE